MIINFIKRILLLGCLLWLWSVYSSKTLVYIGCDPRIASCLEIHPEVSNLSFLLFIAWIGIALFFVYSTFKDLTNKK